MPQPGEQRIGIYIAQISRSKGSEIWSVNRLQHAEHFC